MNKLLFLLSILVCFIYAQCDSDEVEIWDFCYSIEGTTMLYNTDNTSGDFPIAICELTNLEILKYEFVDSNTIKIG